MKILLKILFGAVVLVVLFVGFRSYWYDDQINYENNEVVTNNVPRLLSASLGYPAGYKVILDQRFTYFYDDNGKSTNNMYGLSPVSRSWGAVFNYDLLSGIQDIKGFNLRWYSITEDKFWNISYEFDKNQVRDMAFKCQEMELSSCHSNNASVSIIVAPGGKVHIWLSNDIEQEFINLVQASEVELNWSDFISQISENVQNDFRLQNIDMSSRVAFVDHQFDLLPKSIQYEVKTGSLPVDGERWAPYMAKYPWSLEVSDKFLIRRAKLYLISGEIVNLDQIDDHSFTPRSIPREFILITENKPGNYQRYSIDFSDKALLISVFEEATKHYPNESLIISLVMSDDSVLQGLSLVTSKSRQEFSLGRFEYTSERIGNNSFLRGK